MSGVSKMKVAELREALEARGLDTKGTKPFLVSRLEDAMSRDAAETDEKGRVKEMKETILAEAASPAPATPSRRSRRLSGEYAALAAGGTPARRRLLDNVTASPSRLGSPARKTRRISGGDDRPSTPSRRSRRLSGCSADGDDEEAPQPPPTIPDVIQEVEEEEAGEEQVVKNTQNKDTEVATEEESSKEKPEDPAAAEHAEKTDSKTTGKSDPSDKPADKALESRNEELGNVEKTEEENKEVQVVKADKAEENQVINSRDEENVEEVKDEPVEIESEKSKIEKTVVEDSEKENMPSDEKASDMDTNEKTVEDDSFSSAACDVISSTNTLIANLRQEMASRNSLVAPKQIPRQKPKSGKFWKAERSAFRAIKKDKGQRLSFEQRLALKEEKVRNRDLAKTLLEQKNQKKEEMRKKIEENKAKKLENERKAEQFQVIKNPAKIKRMKKKQLRQLEKRDILAAA